MVNQNCVALHHIDHLPDLKDVIELAHQLETFGDIEFDAFQVEEIGSVTTLQRGSLFDFSDEMATAKGKQSKTYVLYAAGLKDFEGFDPKVSECSYVSLTECRGLWCFEVGISDKPNKLASVWQLCLDLAVMTKPRYGYGFSRCSSKAPRMYVTGTARFPRTNSVEEIRANLDETSRISNWFMVCNNVSLSGRLSQKVRDVYPINIFDWSDARGPDAQHLKDVIFDLGVGDIENVGDDVFVWRLEAAEIQSVYEALSSKGLVITREDRHPIEGSN